MSAHISLEQLNECDCLWQRTVKAFLMEMHRSQTAVNSKQLYKYANDGERWSLSDCWLRRLGLARTCEGGCLKDATEEEEEEEKVRGTLMNGVALFALICNLTYDVNGADLTLLLILKNKRSWIGLNKCEHRRRFSPVERSYQLWHTVSYLYFSSSFFFLALDYSCLSGHLALDHWGPSGDQTINF